MKINNDSLLAEIGVLDPDKSYIFKIGFLSDKWRLTDKLHYLNELHSGLKEAGIKKFLICYTNNEDTKIDIFEAPHSNKRLVLKRRD